MVKGPGLNPFVHPPVVCTLHCLHHRFQSGRAEALGALCRIFCAKKTGEEILPTYLARFLLQLLLLLSFDYLLRFYMAVKEGLKVGPDKVGSHSSIPATSGQIVSECLASILLNSSSLMRTDLEGANLLAPALVTALEAGRNVTIIISHYHGLPVLPEREVRLASASLSKADLRRCSIHLLESLLALPLHFANMPIKELGPGEGGRQPGTNFSQLKPRILNLLVNALQVSDRCNYPLQIHFMCSG